MLSIAGPYGWPAKDFVTHVPQHVQLYLTLFIVFVGTMPVIISCVFFFLLLQAR